MGHCYHCHLGDRGLDLPRPQVAAHSTVKCAMPSRHSTVTSGGSAMLGKFLKKTVLLGTGRTILGVAVLLTVFFATPTTADAAIVQETHSSAYSNTVTMPTHSVGDFIMVTAGCENCATIPTVPAGYTTIDSAAVTAAGSSRSLVIAYKIAASGSETTGTWTNANLISVTVFGSDTAAALSLGAYDERTNSIPSNPFDLYDGFTLQTTDGSSAVYRAHLSAPDLNYTPTGYSTLTPRSPFRMYYKLATSTVSSFSVTQGAVAVTISYGVEIKEYQVPPDPAVVFESPTGDLPVAVNFNASTTALKGRYANFYRVPTGIEFDTLLIKMPDSHTSTTRWSVAGYFDVDLLPIELCAGTDGDNECNGVVSGPASFESTYNCVIVATGVCEIDFGGTKAMSGGRDMLYLAVDPNTPYQAFTYPTSFGDVGYVCDGGLGNCLNQAAVIKLCDNGCADNTLDSTTYNSSFLPLTRIVSMSPSATTTATSTAFALEVVSMVLPADYVDGMELKVTYYRQSNSQLAVVAAFQPGLAPDSGVYEVPITTHGQFTFATTTDIQAIGVYWYTAEIVFPEGFFETILGFFDFGDVTLQEKAYRKNTIFTVVEMNGIDLLYADPNTVITDGVFGNFLENVDATSCNIIGGDFDMIDCLKLLIIPPTPTLVAMWDSLMNNTLRIFPLGYITRFLEIVTLSTPVMPPALEYTYGTSAPAELEGKGMSFQIFDAFPLLLTIVADDGTNKNIWDIVTPFFDTIIALGVLGVILMDILALGLPDFSGGQRARAVDIQPYRANPRDKMTLDLRKKAGYGDIDMRKQ